MSSRNTRRGNKSQSQRGQNSQRANNSQGEATQLTLEESFSQTSIDYYVNDFIRYVIYRAGDHLPIRKADLKKFITIPSANRLMPSVIEKASQILKDIYGYNLIRSHDNLTYYISNHLPFVDDNETTGANESACSSGTEDEFEKPPDAHKILLLLVLTHIFMSTSDYVSEGSMFLFLGELQISTDHKHPLFGDVKDYLLNTLNKQKYIKIEKDSITQKLSFSWGERSEKEISKQQILSFVCKYYKDHRPQSWTSQYKLAQDQGLEGNDDVEMAE